MSKNSIVKEWITSRLGLKILFNTLFFWYVFHCKQKVVLLTINLCSLELGAGI